MQADWNIVKRGWDAHVLGQAPNKFTDATTAVKTLRVRPHSRPYSLHPPALSTCPNTPSSSPGLAFELQLQTQGPEDKPVSDQNIDSFVIVDEEGKPIGTIEDGDAVVLFNFRADRMIEMSKAFEYTDFKEFDRQRFPKVR